MKYLAILALITFSAHAWEVKPPNTILSTYCGENDAPAGERNRIITTVCLAAVQGQQGVTLVTVYSKDSRDKELPVQVLPVVARGTPLVRPTPGTKIEQLRLGTNQTTKSGRYLMYVSRVARLTSQISTVSSPAAYFPKSISGEDLSGVEFNVPKLGGVVHTESIE